ncbi:MAG: hypothetical protein V4622_12275 [Bacteroidota bacterium]
MCREKLTKEAFAIGQDADYNECFWVEDVNGKAIGHLEFDLLLKSLDLIEVDFGNSKRHYVVYSENENISNDLLFFEEITFEEFERFGSEWKDSDSHYVVGDEFYGLNIDEEC